MAADIDYSKPETTILLEMLRGSNGNIPLLKSEITWSDPSVVNPVEHNGRSTSIVATVARSDRYRGNATYYYNRVPLRRLLPQCGRFPRVEVGVTPNLLSNLSHINAQLSLNLSEDSIKDIDLDQAGVNYEDWTLVRVFAKSTSRVYSESVRLYLKRNVILG